MCIGRISHMAASVAVLLGDLGDDLVGSHAAHAVEAGLPIGADGLRARVPRHHVRVALADIGARLQALRLDRRRVNIERVQHELEPVAYDAEIGVGPDADVDRCDELGRRQRPDVQLVDLVDAFDLEHLTDELPGADMVGRLLQEDDAGFLDERHGRYDDDDRDDDRRDGVRPQAPIALAVLDDQRADDHGDVRQRVANDVDDNAPQVQVRRQAPGHQRARLPVPVVVRVCVIRTGGPVRMPVPVPVPEQDHPEDAERQADNADDDEQVGVGGQALVALPFQELVDRVEHHGQTDAEHERGVHQGGDHLHADLPVRAPVRGRLPSRLHGVVADEQGDQVAEHVHGVGDQRQGPSQRAEDELHEEVDGGQEEHGHEAQRQPVTIPGYIGMVVDVVPLVVVHVLAV